MNTKSISIYKLFISIPLTIFLFLIIFDLTNYTYSKSILKRELSQIVSTYISVGTVDISSIKEDYYLDYETTSNGINFYLSTEAKFITPGFALLLSDYKKINVEYVVYAKE